MADLEYSRGALDTLRYFHRCRFVVFVEGPDDVAFWRTVFLAGGATDAYFIVQGGKGALDQHVAAILDGADIVVARDADFVDLAGARVDHPRVLYTYGYSIENTLCSVAALSDVLAAYCALNEEPLAEVAEWRACLCTAIRDIVVLDLAVRMSGLSVSVPLDNAYRFLDRRRKDRVSRAEVERVTSQLGSSLNPTAISDADSRLATSDRDIWYHIRGHCVASAVLHFVSHHVFSTTRRKCSLSHDALFGLLMMRLPISLQRSDEWPYYFRQVKRLLAVA